MMQRPAGAKLNPGIREHLPELFKMVQNLTPPRADCYRILGDALGVTPSLIQHYVLGERKRRREAVQHEVTGTITGPAS
jgi:hypothetical protein